MIGEISVSQFGDLLPPSNKIRKTAEKRKSMKIITKPSQMPRLLSWDAWKRRWGEGNVRWYKHEPSVDDPKEREAMEKALLLKDRLLSFGGELACMDLFDPDYEAIMERGQFWYGDHAKFKKGLPNRCHFNSARMWDANRGKCQIATGYALSDDGCWRQHSWVVQPLTVKYRIWETTEPRIAYFGFIMTDEECEDFLYQNN